ncbi:MAG: hypothetical protein RL367_1253 [Pseudomonadota bacterium]
MRTLLWVLAATLIAAAPAPLPKAEDAAVRAAVRAIFKPYLTKSPDDTPAAWQYPVYATATKALIARWQKATSNPDEVTSLSDFDWLCQCQDYDPKTARIISITTRSTASGADVKAILSPGWKERSPLRLAMVKEKGRWMIADLVFKDGGPPLTSQLRAEIADANKRKK